MKDAQLAASVHPGRFQQSAVQVGIHVHLQEKDGGAGSDGGQDQDPVGIDQAQRYRHLEITDDPQLHRDHHCAQHYPEKSPVPLEVELGKSIGRQGPEICRQQGGGNGNNQAVQEAFPDIHRLLHGNVVVNKRLPGEKAQPPVYLYRGARGIDDHQVKGRETDHRQQDKK